jgi:hypothetical protein
MTIRRRDLLKIAGLSATGAVATAPRTVSADEGQPIVKDVCIIGGGSAGTYTAVRLRDLGKSVVVVEREGRLGGHAETYYDPGTGIPIDIGVIVFENVPLVTNYFARFGVPLLPAGFSGGETAYVDFKTGRLVRGYVPPPRQEAFGAVAMYQQILAQNFPYLDDGFQLPSSVPPDLLLPFGEFVEKYGLQAMVPLVFGYGQGAGDLLQDVSLYVLKLFSANVVNSLLGGGFFVAPTGTSSLYAAAGAFLGSDVLFDSCVVRVDRRRGSIRVWVDTPSGPQRIHCNKLVFACPPTLTSLAPLDLDLTELRLLAGFSSKHYSTGVVRLSGVAPGLSIDNTGTNTPYNLPDLPGTYGLSPSPVPGLWNVKFGSPSPLPDFLVRSAIEADIRRMNRAGTFPVKLEEFEIFKTHVPFQNSVAAQEIARGFYTRLNALQGRNDTFYNGATFQTNDSSLIWRFTEGLLPQILA